MWNYTSLHLLESISICFLYITYNSSFIASALYYKHASVNYPCFISYTVKKMNQDQLFLITPSSLHLVNEFLRRAQKKMPSGI